MLPSYSDITSRIAEGPSWHDANGVPRYETFAPAMLGVYDDFAVLAEIACQACGRRSLVGAGWTRFDVFADPIIERTLADLVESFDYGDAPRHDYKEMGRCAGETMSSEMVRVVEAWEKVALEWLRVSEYESALGLPPPMPVPAVAGHRRATDRASGR